MFSLYSLLSERLDYSTRVKQKQRAVHLDKAQSSYVCTFDRGSL